MTILNLQIQYFGKSPIQGGGANRKRLTALQIAQLIYAEAHGSRFRGSGPGAPGEQYIQYQTGVVAATNTAVLTSVLVADTISIAGTALTATKQRASATVTAATATAGQTVTVNGQIFTAVSGAATLGEATFSIDTGNNETATSLAAQINAYGGPKVGGLVSAKSASAVVTVFADTSGTAGNSLSLASSDGATLAVSGALLSGGVAIANNQFDVTTDALAADSLAYAINNSTTAAVQQVTAVSNGVNTVTVTAKVGGVAGNAITWTSSNARIDVGLAGVLENGAADAAVRMTF